MRDHDRAAGEVEQRVFQCAQRVDVEVVGRLVEQQDVATALQHLREVHAVALTTRELAHRLLLVAAAKVEPRGVLARVDLLLAEQHDVLAAGDLLPHGALRVEARARLVDIAELHGVADPQLARVGRLLAGDHPEQRRLAGAVRADHADDPGRRQREREVLEQQPVAEALRDVLRLDHDVAEPRPRRNVDLDLVEAHRVLVREQFLVGAEARFRLRMPCLRRQAHPLELARERPLASRGLLLLDLQPHLLLLEPARVVALVRDASAAVELEDPAGDVVEEVPVMRDRDDGALVVRQEALEPEDRFRIEVVRRLVEE